MTARVSPTTQAPEAYRALAGVNTALENSSLGRKLIDLVYLRVSQLNGCAFCVDMHARDLIAAGEDWQRVNSLSTWHEVGFYTDRERAALAWAESLTKLADTGAPDETYAALEPHFSKKEIGELTFAAAVINAWNRIGAGLRLPVQAKPLKAVTP
ncbi:MAG: carboxymuconolactone decarboxylase family protein [Proteobacteria bacterium]|nr:carboxymuconolactone decarboxylase family protein [Pseudomonadota bacterium]